MPTHVATSDAQIEQMIEDGRLLVPPVGDYIKSPEEWDATGWDEGRGRPKTVAEARAMLRQRSETTGEDASAYDELKD